ncbi:related to OCA1 - putative protein tyrosine phosphatase [Ustilago trichophora]|uniref:Uncharacterized protein n=1 Tax=Ustilago trichophora TaxID=86804 RepID=A0A5C3EHE1_9BASI|nr:related to OCA1 - putative protein tyrosine phosphatase [Ustilago trichophora]
MSSAHLAPPGSSKLSTSPSSTSSGHPHHHHHHHSSNTFSSSHHSHTHNIPTAPLVEPPSLFASVVPQIYRSATPTPANHSFLRTLQLKTILSLTAELPSPSLTAFCKKHGIKFLHFGLKRWGNEDNFSSPFPFASSHQHTGATNDDQDNLTHLDLSFLHSITPTSTHTNNTSYRSSFSSSSPTLTEELVKDSLQILLNSTYHPVLVTDTSGIHEIGVLLGCLRKLQRWNFATILLEYRHFAGNRARATNERFVEMFDTDLISYPDQEAPEWFKEQIREDDAELDRVESLCT